MSLTSEYLRELSTKIAANPDAVYDLEPEELVSARKYINPLGGVVQAKKTYVNLSLINWKESYLRKLHTTALIGYVYRTLEEYEPEDEIEKEKELLAQKTAKLDPSSEEFATLQQKSTERIKLLKNTAREIIRKFLNRNFEFNPDYHLRGSHSENPKDPERGLKDDKIKAVCATASKSPEIVEKLNSKHDATFKYLRANMLTAYQQTLEASRTVKNTLMVLTDPETNIEDKQGILIKKYNQLQAICDDMKKIAEPLAAADTLDAWKHDPPVDVFHQFNRYLTNHYEQLREVCSALYNEKPDFEYAVILYDAFKTPEAAREYRIQHEAEFRAEVLTIENGAVTLVGPFKENRARVDFFNKNTEVMKRMLEQVESDHKLGKDLMEKQVRMKKKKNIEEAGPDNPALATYAKTMNTVQELGAKKILTREEQEKLANAKKTAQNLKEDYEVPDDAIQIDMFFPSTTEEGTTLKKTKWYSQAEAPLHMQEGSQYTDQYQPKRSEDESLDIAYRTKIIKGRHGQSMEVKVPASEENNV